MNEWPTLFNQGENISKTSGNYGNNINNINKFEDIRDRSLF